MVLLGLDHDVPGTDQNRVDPPAAGYGRSVAPTPGSRLDVTPQHGFQSTSHPFSIKSPRPTMRRAMQRSAPVANTMTSTNPSLPLSRPPLPHHNERPPRAVVIYDGRCSFCIARSEQLARWDRDRRLTFLPIDDPERPVLFPRLETAALRRDMHVVAQSGDILRGAAAVRYLCKLLPRLWCLVPLLYIPRSLPIWQWLYHQIATRRYRLSKSATWSCSGQCATVQDTTTSTPSPSASSQPETTTNHDATHARLESTLRRGERAVG